MANTTTTTLTGALPTIVAEAIQNTMDLPVLFETVRQRYLREGEGKTVKFPLLPNSTGDITAASESSGFSTTAYSISSATATVVENGFAMEISDFAVQSSAVSLEQMIGELMVANRMYMDKVIAALFSGFTTVLPVENATLTASKLFEGVGKLLTGTGNVAIGSGDLFAGIHVKQYASLLQDLAKASGSGANIIGTNPITQLAESGNVPTLYGVGLRPTTQVSNSGTSDNIGLLYHRNAIGAAIQALPTVVMERKALLPNGGIQGWIVSVAHRFGVVELRDNFGVQLQTD